MEMSKQDRQPIKVIIFGATGHVGYCLINAALAQGHDVSVFVRDPRKLQRHHDAATLSRLNVFVGDILDGDAAGQAMRGHNAVVDAAGHNQDAEIYTALCKSIVSQAKALLPPQRIWVYGGLPGLDVPHTKTSGTDLPFMPVLFRAHKPNYEVVKESGLDWTFVCPGPMYFAGRPGRAQNLNVTIDVMPYHVGRWTRFLPKVFHPFIMYFHLKELATAYEDVAALVMSNLEADGPYSRKRIGVIDKSF
jgi:putative NADH-flavin reductase